MIVVNINLRMAPPLNAVATLITADNSTQRLCLEGDLSAARFDNLEHLTEAVRALIAQILRIPIPEVQVLQRLEGVLPDVYPTLSLRAHCDDPDVAARARAAVAELVASVTQAHRSKPLFTTPAELALADRAAIDAERTRLLGIVSGTCVKSKTLVQIENDPPLVVEGRWETAPNDQPPPESKVVDIRAYVDGFRHSRRQLYVCDVILHVSYVIQFDELEYLDDVKRLSALITHHSRPLCEIKVEKQVIGSKETLLLRSLKVIELSIDSSAQGPFVLTPPPESPVEATT